MNLLTALKTKLLQALQILAKMKTMEPQIVTMLDKLCLGIRDFEGVPGDQNYRLNNPGNCRYFSGGYLPKYEPVKESSNGFAIFPSYQSGWEYLEAMITQRIQNHPDWSLLQFMENYAPYTDGNNPFVYATFLAKRMQVDVSYPVKDILL